jgi:hypothetical protein
MPYSARDEQEFDIAVSTTELGRAISLDLIDGISYQLTTREAGVLGGSFLLEVSNKYEPDTTTRDDWVPITGSTYTIPTVTDPALDKTLIIDAESYYRWIRPVVTNLDGAVALEGVYYFIGKGGL